MRVKPVASMLRRPFSSSAPTDGLEGIRSRLGSSPFVTWQAFYMTTFAVGSSMAAALHWGNSQHADRLTVGLKEFVTTKQAETTKEIASLRVEVGNKQEEMANKQAETTKEIASLRVEVANKQAEMAIKQAEMAIKQAEMANRQAEMANRQAETTKEIAGLRKDMQAVLSQLGIVMHQEHAGVPLQLDASKAA